jgi:hypothetical protein
MMILLKKIREYPPYLNFDEEIKEKNEIQKKKLV